MIENSRMTVGTAVRSVLRAAARRDAADLARAVAIAGYGIATITPAAAAELPVPCIAGSCGVNGPLGWVTSGNATGTVNSNSLTIDQTTNNLVLNWQSFNISRDGTVTFQQPNTSAIALNRIYQNSPSQIFGALNANGRVYLVNQNGILFGGGARVNVGGLVASAVNIAEDAVQNGITQPARTNNPAFVADADHLDSSVIVQQGARIETASGGQVFLLAPESVTNEGTISTPDGQTILAAGRSVYLATSSDENLRGIVVEVNDGGEVTNGRIGGATGRSPQDVVGQIVAERGNITLAGLAVNQHGRLSATTSVRANGTIRLQARDTASVVQSGGVTLLSAQRGGELTVDRDAITEVTLSHDDTQTQVDVNEQLASGITMDGAHVRLREGSRTTATSGNVTITARTDPQASPTNGSYSPDPNDARLYIANGATIDVSGAQVVLPMERNVVRAELRGSQTANSPEQRDGVLRGQTVYVDVRRSGVREDGTTWQGTPLADLSGDIAAVPRTVEERSLRGGQVTLHSQGSVLIAQDSLIDVSGGSIQYLDGLINTSQLLSGGRIYDIGDADPNRRYDGIGNVFVVDHPKWGVSETFTSFGTGTNGRFEQGYIEGKDAGSVSIVAPWLALDGRIDGSVVRGPHQRQPSQTLATDQVYRAYNQVPLGGRLEIGFADTSENRNAVLADVRIAPGFVLPALLNEDGALFDPEKDLLPADRDDVSIRPEVLGSLGVSRLAVYSNGRITVPTDVEITTPAGGQFVAAGSSLDIGGHINSPSGSIELTARTTRTHSTDISLLVGSEARLSAIGGWVNDSPLLNTPGALLDPLFINGGRISISSQQGQLQLARGSVIDVSSGASRASNGAIKSGRGGNVSLSTSPDSTDGKLAEPVPLILDAEIRGHSLGAGGQLSITASAICIASEDCNGSDQVTPAQLLEPTMLWLRPQLLEDSGFGSYRLSSNRGGLSVAAGTQIGLQQRSVELTGDLSAQPSTDSVRSFSQLTRLDDFQRRPVDLTLNVAANPGTAVSNSADFFAVPELSIGTGSSILGDLSATVALRSNSRMIIDGVISAPAGVIAVDLNADLTLNQFFPAGQAIRLGEHAQLSASGATRVRTDDLGRRQGDVLAGGSVSLNAQRGYVIASPGSVIDVSGTATTLEIRSDSQGSMLATNVASDAGHIAVTAAEGFFLSGEIAGHAGGTNVRGGELSLTLNPEPRNDAGSPVSWFPAGPRIIDVQEHQSPVVIADDAGVPNFMNGLGTIAFEDIEQGGFDALSLTARELQGRSTGQLELRSRGVIRFDGDVQLSLGRSITLDASTIDAGNNVSLAAPVVSIGASSRMHQSLPAVIEEGLGHFSVQAALLDFYGNVALQGVAGASFSSTGDIRFRGVQLERAVELDGSLVAAGDMTFSARQLYPSTLTNFDISSRGSQSTIRVRAAEGASAPVLSAGGNLTLQANSILSEGVLRAPFGSIELRGNRVELLAGSITSTSADGLLIPFGQTQGGFDWVYPLLDQGGPNAHTLVFGHGGAELPQQRVTLDSADIRVHAGATINLSAGGDLLAFEFEPGVGGTHDVLSNTYRPNQYAIIPSLALDYAPFDQNLSEGSNLRVGDSVYLSGMPGLAAGTYTLLPARYALLPGAYLVSAVDGYQDILAGERFAQLDGGTVVAGYRTVAGTDVRDSHSSGFVIRSGSDAQREAHYEIARATEFFRAQAVSEGTAAPRLPNDAGILSISAGGQLLLEGSLRAAAGAEGRGAAVDISGTRLRIVSGNASAAEDGEVLIDAAALRNLGAESVLLGARRSQTAEGVLLDVSADQVTVDAGAELVAPELLLAATDIVEVRSGASITATGATSNVDEALLVSGDGALLRASAGDQMRIERTEDVGVQGRLNIAAGAVISARNGSALFDATRDTQSSGELDVSGASLNLAAARISLGDEPASAEGLRLEAAQFSGLDLRELVLTSRSVVDLYGSVNLGVRDLTVHAGGIVSRTGGDVSLTAGETLSVANPNGVTTPPVLNGDGSLTLTARDIELGAGEFAVQGVSDTRFVAGNQILGEESGSTRVSGNLQLSAARITTASGADRTISASGALTTLAVSSPTDTPTPAEIAGVGGRLNLEGASIFHGGRIEMASGNVRLEALGPDVAGGITLGDGSAIALAGTSRTFDGVDVSAPGGVATIISRNGSVNAQGGSIVDVSGAVAGGDAGKITVEAVRGAAILEGTLLGRAAQTREGGSISVDAATLNGFDALTSALNSGGFNQSRTFRQRGPGDLVVSADPSAVIAARNVSLSADQGSAIVNGLINASGSSGGSISLAARDNVLVNGTILANAIATGGRGGQVLLSSTNGGVLLESSSRIDVSAGAAQGPEPVRAGEVTVRVPRAAALSVLDATPADDQLRLDGTVVGAGRYWVEGYQTYVDADGILDVTDVTASTSPFHADAVSFMTNASAIVAALQRTNDPAFKVVPGVEVRSDGDLTLSADWNLYDWHFVNDAPDDTPGILTLRAGGNLTFNRSLSDGFATLDAFVLYQPNDDNDPPPAESWSYRLIGGADLNSADALAVRSRLELTDGGDVTLSVADRDTCCVPIDPFGTPVYRMIRTGTGDITIRAARDLVFGDPHNRGVLDQTAMIYTAGVSVPILRLPTEFFGTNSPALPYPVDGGDISIRTGGAVRGAPSNQLVTDWLWRAGAQPTSESDPGVPTAWTVNFTNFMQGVGALAGGNIEVVAGADVENLSLNLPTIGRQIGLGAHDNKVEVVGAGNLRVDADGSILGGTFLIGNGSAHLRSQEDIAAPEVPQLSGSRSVGSLLGIVGNGSYDLVARKNVEIESVFNATLIAQGSSQQASPQSFFYTYGDRSAVDLLSVGGDVVFHNDPAIAAMFGSSPMGAVEAKALQVYPGTVRATGFDGNVEVIKSMLLSPASKGNLELFAQNDVVFGEPTDSLVLILSDSDPAVLPSIYHPENNILVFDSLLKSPISDPNQHGAVPVHSLAAQTDGIADSSPVRVVARTGDIYMNTSLEGGNTGLYLAKQSRLIAGRDIRELSLFGQHVTDGDVTTVYAGRDITYGLRRLPSGILAGSAGGIVLDGPGNLEVIAGRHVDLQASNGITTQGNLLNPALPDGGASVSALTGVGSQSPNYTAFADAYLRDTTAYDESLMAFLTEITGSQDLSKSRALELFATLTEAQRNRFLQSVLFAELRASGREAARTGSGDFTRGFDALETLFPGSNPDTDAGETNPYVGDFNGYFSRVYTLDGGDINLLVPGGEINVGLATPPTSFGIAKTASQLGVVAQSTGSVSALAFNDFLVNESRVFSADGGDILVWSTRGDIDAGRGAKTAISAPAPVVSFDVNGNVQVSFPAALAGSGIQTLATSRGRKPGNVDLFAPRGVVNAGDAGIVAGNLTIAATAVLGADNIQVSGVAVGVPVDAGGLGASLAGVSSVASGASNAAAASVETNRGQEEQQSSLADAALSWLEVFVVGLGEENCKQDDVECLKRQKID